MIAQSEEMRDGRVFGVAGYLHICHRYPLPLQPDVECAACTAAWTDHLRASFAWEERRSARRARWARWQHRLSEMAYAGAVLVLMASFWWETRGFWFECLRMWFGQ